MNFSKLLFLIASVLCIPLYVYEKLTNIDSVSGFFLNKGGLVTVFYAILVLALAGMVFYSLKLMKRYHFSISNSKLLAVLSLGLGVAMIVSGASNMLSLFDDTSAAGGAAFTNSGALILASCVFLISLLSGGVFLRLSVSFFREDIKNRGSYTFLFPILWALINCVSLYTDYPQIAGMPDRVLYLLCLLSFTVFLVGQGRVLSDVNMDRGVRLLCGFGFVSALTGLVLVVGELSAIKNGLALPVFDLVLSFIISLYCLCFAVGTKTGDKG